MKAPAVGFAHVTSFLTRATAALDRGVVRIMERRIAPRGREPATDLHDARARLVALADRYCDGTLGVPSPFFPEPPLPEMTLTPQGDGPLGTQIAHLVWTSGYEPYLPEARELCGAAIENHTAHARWWTSGRGRPTIVLLHGWGADNRFINERAFVVPYWLAQGFDVVAVVLPYHGARAPGGGRSGALFPSANPMRTNEGFGQTIFELRALSRWLRSRGSSAVGAMGMSLGGYTAALWASIAGVAEAERGGIDFAVAIIPAVSFAKLFWRHGETNPTRREAQRAGVSEELLENAFAVHAPLTRPVRLPPERLAVIAGRGDRITFPEQAERLASHWGVDVGWFDGGHLVHAGRAEAMRAVRRQLEGLALPGCVRRRESRAR